MAPDQISAKRAFSSYGFDPCSLSNFQFTQFHFKSLFTVRRILCKYGITLLLGLLYSNFRIYQEKTGAVFLPTPVFSDMLIGSLIRCREYTEFNVAEREADAGMDPSELLVAQASAVCLRRDVDFALCQSGMAPPALAAAAM